MSLWKEEDGFLSKDYKFNPKRYTLNPYHDCYYCGWYIQSLYMYKMYIQQRREFKDVKDDNDIINGMTNSINGLMCNMMLHVGAYTKSTFNQIIQGDEKLLNKYKYVSTYFNGSTYSILVNVMANQDSNVRNTFFEHDVLEHGGNYAKFQKYFERIEKDLLPRVNHYFSLLLFYKREKRNVIETDERITAICQQLHAIDEKTYTIEKLNEFLSQFISKKLCSSEHDQESCLESFENSNSQVFCDKHWKIALHNIIHPIFSEIGLRDLVSTIIEYS